ncbi:hypothetical protein FPZ44_05180 [Paenibacillus agilis]|uniref:Hint domain-containing protein n=2 Tax=Paenibacillus agilis TaxID=3020863 RepID=A0A559J3X7_9BACL|nr:hypothetical protein FPZ44_05180 [Paenibacillus agilis]
MVRGANCLSQTNYRSGFNELYNALFLWGTNIQTKGDCKTFENIVVRDKVLANSEEIGELAYKEVEDTFQRVAEETYHVTVKDTTFVTTEEHSFWVPGIGWVDARDLKEGDKLVDNEGIE